MDLLLIIAFQISFDCSVFMFKSPIIYDQFITYYKYIIEQLIDNLKLNEQWPLENQVPLCSRLLQ